MNIKNLLKNKKEKISISDTMRGDAAKRIPSVICGSGAAAVVTIVRRT